VFLVICTLGDDDDDDDDDDNNNNNNNNNNIFKRSAVLHFQLHQLSKFKSYVASISFLSLLLLQACFKHSPVGHIITNCL
jgi:hypothetical protein